jgi:hypothetical protein
MPKAPGFIYCTFLLKSRFSEAYAALLNLPIASVKFVVFFTIKTQMIMMIWKQKAFSDFECIQQTQP